MDDLTNYASTLSSAQRKKYRILAYASTWFGNFSDVMIDSSAILILYFTMLGSSSSMVMLTTSLTGLTSMFLFIPSAGIVNKFGPKKVIEYSCYLGTISLLFVAVSPLFGETLDQYIAFAGCLFYCISKAIWPPAWYPILNSILLPKERAGFFGFLRFSYFILTGSVFWLIGHFMGEKPPVWFLQLVIGVIGVMVMGRHFCLVRIPLPEIKSESTNIKESLIATIKNSSLVGFSVYICILLFAFSPVLPLALKYLKSGLNLGDGFVQEVSAFGIAGMVLGYLLYSTILRLIGMRTLQLSVHALYFVVPVGIFFFGANHIAVTLLYFVGSFAYACFWCMMSQEILALANPKSFAMGSAFVQTYQMIGMGLGRVASSVLLCGMLAVAWDWKVDLGFIDITLTISQYQTIFLFCGAMSLLSAIFIVCLPSIVPQHDDYYNP